MNVSTPDYASSKGEAASDIDEGKITILLVHCLTERPDLKDKVMCCLRRLRAAYTSGERLMPEVRQSLKQRVVSILQEVGSFEHALQMLGQLEKDIQARLRGLRR